MRGEVRVCDQAFADKIVSFEQTGVLEEV